MNPRWLVIGAVVAVVVLRLAHFATEPGDQVVLGLVLAYTAAIYPGAALANDQRRWLGIEAGVSVVMLAIAWLGLWASPLWLALGYALHGVWDAVHHPRLIQTRIVPWFPPASAAFDLVVAVWIVFWFR